MGFIEGGTQAVGEIWTEGTNILRAADPYANLVGALLGNAPVPPSLRQSPVMALEDWQARELRAARYNNGDGPGGGGRW